MATVEHNLDIDDVESHLYDIEALLSQGRLQEDVGDSAALPRSEDGQPLDRDQLQEALRQRLAALDNAYLAYIIEAVAEEDRSSLWELVDAARRPAILERVSSDARQRLQPSQPEEAPRKFPNAYKLQAGRLHQISINCRQDLERAEPVWVDLIAPTADERALIEEIFGLNIPVPEEHTDLEASARFYVEEDGAIYLHSDFLLDKENESRNVPVTFILHRDILFSVREMELPVFRLQRLRARTQVGFVTDCQDLLLDLYAADVEYSADALEDIYMALEVVGRRVLSTEMTDSEAAQVLAAIAREEDINGRIRRNVMDTRRAVSFLMRGRFLAAEQIADSQQLLRDIESLDGHTSFLFDKINFLMDATVGFININQNKIIRIFSVASVALLPPTLIASIYGMNFKIMPELEWDFGYPFSLTLMVISVVLPLWWFYRKGWLK